MEISASDVNWHELETSEAMKLLETTERGLSESEAETRLQKFGRNELQKQKGISKLKIFALQFKSFLILILVAATIFSAFIGELIDAAAIITIVVLNAIFGFVQEYKAEKTIEALQKLTSPEAVVRRDGKERKIDSRFIVPGDIIVLDEGSRIPADMRLINVAELRIDEAILTGESVPVSKKTEPLKSASVADRKNLAYMGTLVTYGRGIGIVIGTGMKTEMGKIAHVVQEEEEQSTPLQKKISSFGRLLGIIILLICAIIIVIGIAREGPLAGKPLTESLVVTLVITGIALAVAAIPEGLPAVMTITLALGLQRLAKRNALIRKLPAVEALGSTTVICCDKTGTLTKNEMTISEMWFPDKTVDVTGEGYRPEGKLLVDRKEITEKDMGTASFMLKVGALCNNACLENKNGQYGIIGDPTEAAIVVAAAKIGHEKTALESKHKREHEFPFSSERKMMTTIHLIPDASKRYYSCSKGAPEIMLNICENIMVDGKPMKMTSAWKEKIVQKNTEMTGKALRVLAIAYKETDSIDAKSAETGMTFLGLVGMIDPPREEAIESVKVCKKAGIRVIMITGDHKNTAAAVAQKLGILDGGKVVTGEELDAMDEKELEKIVKDVSVFARVDPLHKVRIVDALKKRGEIIAMTGDGVNDAPALKKADIGIAMGIKGTDVAKEASKMILSDDNFVSIVNAVHEGRAIYDNIKKFMQFLLSCNVGEVMVVFFAMLIGFQDPSTLEIILPLTAIQLLWINLLTDGLPALALGIDPPSQGIMSRSPRNPKEAILTRYMLIEILVFGTVMCAATLLLFDMNLQFGSVKAITIAFTAIVMFEMVRAYLVRMKYKIGLLSNNKLSLAVASSVALQLLIVYAPLMQPVFGTTALNLMDWAEISAASFFLFVTMWVYGKLAGGRQYD
jgi:Ca2+-transporting ATPase